VLGPVTLSGLGGGTPEGVVFEYTDAYSVFDWGKMPDLLAHKGEALAVIAAELFERLERPDTWRDFSRTQEAFDLRKESHFGAVFNEIGEKLQKEGLRTHYLGVLSEKPGATSVQARMIKDVTRSVHHILARRVTAERPKLVQILGRTVPDYHVTRQSKPPRLIPLEVVFRFSCPPGSSYKAEPGQKWNFPVLQLFTKLENSDRLVDIAEALAISGVPGEVLQEMLLKTAWVSTLLKSLCSAAGFELADGKLEWAVNEAGECILVDAIGPDELRILRGGVQLSKEVLRDCYKSTEWYASVV
jgi:phosphoribosylaminoimidazole-succinocarboxamide synthase